MARFNYRLQGVLNLRLQQEEQAKTDFAEATRQLNEQQDKLKQLVNTKQSYIDEGYQLRSAPVMDVLAIRDNAAAQNHMDTLIEKQKQVIERYEGRHEVARIKLARSVQERKMQERLRERAFEEYLEEEKEAESKEMDERTSFTYTKRAREES